MTSQTTTKEKDRSDSWRESRWDTAIEWLMIGLLVFMPLAFGVVEAWSEMVVFSIVAAMSVCLALKHWQRGEVRFAWTWSYMPLFLLTILVVFQTIPLSDDWLSRISPQTVETRRSLLSDSTTNAMPETGTLSLYPCGTRHDLRLILVAAAVFVIVVNVFRDSRRIKRLLRAIALIGFAFAFLALLQVLSGAAQIYWAVKTPVPLANSGSFINHSNYSQFMNLSIGAALALLLVRLKEDSRRRGHKTPDVPKASRVAWPMAMIVLAGVTVCTSLSRTGIFSMVCATLFTSVLMAFKRRFRRLAWILAVLPLVAFAGLLVVGLDVVYERLGTMAEWNQIEGRLEMTRCSLDAWRHYPLFGAGWGTYEYVFPMFDTSKTSAVAQHADNDYAELLVEAGIVGAVFLGLFLIGIAWHYVRLVRKGRSSISMAAFGLGFGLLAVLIHSATDFGQRLPANFCLSAVACGLLVAIARRERERHHRHRSQPLKIAPSLSRRMAATVVFFMLIAGWGWVLCGANASWIAEQSWANVTGIVEELQQDSWQGSNDDYTELIGSAAIASDAEPDNVKYRYWLNVYRWYSISRTVDPETGLVVLDPEMVPFVEQIVDELSQVRILCPTFGPPYSVEGQMRLFVLKQPVGDELIQRGYRLAPCDPSTCFIAGRLAVSKGDLETAAARFKRAIDLDERMFSGVIPIFVDELHRPDVLRDMADNEPRYLMPIAVYLSATEDDENILLADDIREQAFAVLTERFKSEDAIAARLQRARESVGTYNARYESERAIATEFAWLASLCERKEDFEAAISWYQRALDLDYRNVGWHLALARALAEMERWDDAIHEARICLRLRPHMASAEELIKRWCVRDPVAE